MNITRYKQLSILFVSFFLTLQGVAQIELNLEGASDIGTAAFICTKSLHIAPFQGAGNTTTNAECIPQETNALWLNWQAIGSVGESLTFTITPDNPDINIDFVLFESDNRQELTNPDPRKCSTSTCLGATGLRVGASNAEENPFDCNTSTNNGFLSPAIQFNKFYALLINTTSDDNGFTIEFEGNVEFAGPKPTIESSVGNEACYGETVIFSLPDDFDDTGIERYEWNLGEDIFITSFERERMVENTYTTEGQKTITLTVETDSGCRVMTEYELTVSNCCETDNQISVDTTLVQVVSCPSDANGAINIEVTTSSPLTYTVLWSNNETTENISGLDAGTYGVTVTNEASCEAILDNIVLETPDVLKLEVTDTVISNCTMNTQTEIVALAEGGRGPYLYNFGQNQDTLPANNALLGIGQHLVTVKDASGCTDTATLSIQHLSLEPEVSILNNAFCKDSSGAIQITETLGTAPYFYDLGNGISSSSDMLSVPAGGYTLTVTDANECTGTTVFAISEPDDLIVTIDGDGSTLACTGENTASLLARPNGGTPPYSYLWEDGSTTQERDNLIAGTYLLTVTDDNGCEVRSESNINQPESLVASIANAVAPTCAGTQGGAIQLDVSGGTGTYTYSMDNGVTFQSLPTNLLIEDLAPMDYSIIIQDGNNCEAPPLAVTINSPAMLISNDSIINVTNCRDNNNGGLIITTEGGTEPYLFEFAIPAGIFASNTTGRIIDSLPTGNYTVFITDANGCTDMLTGIEITELELNIDTISTKDLDCNNDNSGEVELSINGDTNTQDFLFDISNMGMRQGDSILTALPAGDYEIDVYDFNGCQGTSPQFSIGEPAPIIPSANFGRINCFGAMEGTAIVIPTGGTGDYTFDWSNGEMTRQLSNVPAGEYAVTVSDANGCSEITSFTIEQNEPITVNNITPIDVACPDNPNGAFELDVTGGISPYQYSIDNGNTFGDSTILTNLTAGDYEIIIQDAEGCDTMITATIQSPTNIDVTVLSDIECYGSIFTFVESVNLTPDDNIVALNWSFGEGATPATATGVGPHEVVYTTIGTPEVMLTIITDKCGELTPNIINGADVPNSFTIAPCCDINGISLTTDVDSTSCADMEDGRIGLTIDTNAPVTTIDWDNEGDTEIIENLAAGNYAVTVTNEATCTESISALVESPQGLSLTSETTNPSCGGGTDGIITINVSGGTGTYSYDFGNGTGFQTENFVSNFNVFSYDLMLMDENNCQAESIALLMEKELEFAPADIQPPTCFGDADASIDITVNNGVAPYQYNLNSSGFDDVSALNSLIAGNYTIEVMDAELCRGNIDVIIVDPEAVTVNMQTVQNISCFGERDGQLRATASGGDNNYTYAWDVGGSDPLLTNLPPGEYTVTVTDGKGCSNTETGLVIEPIELSAQATPQAVFCFGETNGAITITGIGGTEPYSYSLDGVFFQPTPTFNNLTAGDYTAFVQDNSGCESQTDISVEEPTEFSLIATQDQTVQLGDEIQLRAIVTDDNGVVYNWTGPDPLSCNDCPDPRIQPSQSGFYTVTAINPSNCSASDTVNVLVNFDRPVFIPTAFSPNGDGINDEFYIQSTGAIEVIRRLSVFDRFGSLLYNQTGIQPNDPTIGWDGSFNGEPVQIGVYIIQAEIEFIDKEVILYTQDVTVTKARQ